MYGLKPVPFKNSGFSAACLAPEVRLFISAQENLEDRKTVPQRLKPVRAMLFTAQSKTVFLTLPFDLSLVFITFGEPQARADTAEAVPFQNRVPTHAL